MTNMRHQNRQRIAKLPNLKYRHRGANKKKKIKIRIEMDWKDYGIKMNIL